MTEQKLKELLDICFIAKRIAETMPDLPNGIKPRHIHVIVPFMNSDKVEKWCGSVI